MSEALNDDTPWTTVTINIPPELNGYEADFIRFWDAMVFKMRRNAHRGKWQDVPLDTAFVALANEVDELKTAIRHGSTSEILFESADCANEALIVAAIGLEKAGV
jgi:NTP pyrophosphatase (non-canonical NTP hydrolase)